MTNPALSLCMITKNEEKFLEQCLNSVKDIVDEIVIVDTGSTDKTKEICKKFQSKSNNALKFFDFNWVDDFSAARNESIKHATKDWILVMDADEVLDEEGKNKIKDLINDKEADAFLFIQKNYTNNSSIKGFVNEEHGIASNTYAGWYGSSIVRLFRNRKGYKFEGIVHELVEHSIANNNGKISATNISVHHYGNANPILEKKKKQFYLELCKKKAELNQDASSYYELGVLYKENNNFDEAISSFKTAIELNQNHNLALFEMGVIYEKKGEMDNAIQSYTNSLRIKEFIEAFQNLGVCYFKKGMLDEAYNNLVKAVALNPNKYTIYNNLGAVLEKKGNYESAVQMLEISIKLNPKNTIGFYNLGIALDKKGDFENAIKNYEKAVELGHKNKEEIKKRINQLKLIAANSPKYDYKFKVGG